MSLLIKRPLPFQAHESTLSPCLRKYICTILSHISQASPVKSEFTYIFETYDSRKPQNIQGTHWPDGWIVSKFGIWHVVQGVTHGSKWNALVPGVNYLTFKISSFLDLEVWLGKLELTGACGALQTLRFRYLEWEKGSAKSNHVGPRFWVSLFGETRCAVSVSTASSVHFCRWVSVSRH